MRAPGRSSCSHTGRPDGPTRVRLAATLDAAPPTLCHGDAWLVNIALNDDQVVLLDGALATAGPASLDLVEFTVDPDGHITNERVSQSADPSLDRAAFNAVKQFSCVSQGQAVRVQVPFSFNLN